MSARRRMAGALAPLVVMAAIAGLPSTAHAAGAATPGTPQEVTTLPAPPMVPHRGDRPVVSGETGFLHQEQGVPGYTWTIYGGGDTPVPQVPGGPSAPTPVTAGGDSIAYWTGAGSPTSPLQLTVGSPANGSAPWTTYTLPNVVRIFGVGEGGTRALVREADGMHLLQLNADGTTTEVALTGMPDPATYDIGGLPAPTVDAESHTVATFNAVPKSGTGGPQLYLLHLDTGAAVPLPASFPRYSRVSGHYVFSLSTDTVAGTITIQSLDLVADTWGGDTTPMVTTWPMAGVIDPAARIIGTELVGDQVLVLTSSPSGYSLADFPLHHGGTLAPFLVDSVITPGIGANYMLDGPGSVVMVGGDSKNQSVQRFVGRANGLLETDLAMPLPPPSGTTVTLSMDYGQVRQVLSVPQLDGTTKLGMATTPLAAASSGSGPLGTGPQSTGYLATQPGCMGELTCIRIVDGSVYGVSLETPSGAVQAGGIGHDFGPVASVVDADNEFEIVNADQQYLWEPGQDAVSSLGMSETGAALWQNTLWRSSTTTPGQIQAFALTSGLRSMPLRRTISTGASCTPSEIQVAQHWLYWSCGGAAVNSPAGVYDLATGTEISVSGGPALLGDGYLVRHDVASGQLQLTDLHSDSVGTTTTLATFPATGPRNDDRHLTWTVDRTTGDVAYADAANVVHVLTPGVPASPVTAVSSQSQDVLAVRQGYPLNVAGVLSRPVASWRLVFSDAATGRQVHVVTGGPTPAGFSGGWDGSADDGTKAFDGRYTWQLWATPADNPTAAATPVTGASGAVQLQLGRQTFRSYNEDGRPDLFGITAANTNRYAAGDSVMYEGEAKGDSMLNQGPQWWVGLDSAAGGINTLVPFGDLNGDGRNDLLVRTGNGTLGYYSGLPSCSNPGVCRPPITIGGGWNIYDRLVSVGDLNGDGHDDLVARDRSGVLWFYAGTGHGGFAPRVRLGGGWNAYTQIIGVGDLNGEGAGDLLAVDAAGRMWRYLGNGHGGFGARTLLGAGWNTYDALVGIGDLNGDGHNDLVARDRSGILWFYAGDGHGGLARRAKVGGGWNRYTTIY